MEAERLQGVISCSILLLGLYEMRPVVFGKTETFPRNHFIFTNVRELTIQC